MEDVRFRVGWLLSFWNILSTRPPAAFYTVIWIWKQDGTDIRIPLEWNWGHSTSEYSGVWLIDYRRATVRYLLRFSPVPMGNNTLARKGSLQFSFPSLRTWLDTYRLGSSLGFKSTFHQSRPLSVKTFTHISTSICKFSNHSGIMHLSLKLSAAIFALQAPITPEVNIRHNILKSSKCI